MVILCSSAHSSKVSTHLINEQVYYMSQVRVFTGPRRWSLQDAEGNIFYVDIWAIEAIAKTIRQIDSLGEEYDILITQKSTLEEFDT